METLSPPVFRFPRSLVPLVDISSFIHLFAQNTRTFLSAFLEPLKLLFVLVRLEAVLNVDMFRDKAKISEDIVDASEIIEATQSVEEPTLRRNKRKNRKKIFTNLLRRGFCSK